MAKIKPSGRHRHYPFAKDVKYTARIFRVGTKAKNFEACLFSGRPGQSQAHGGPFCAKARNPRRAVGMAFAKAARSIAGRRGAFAGRRRRRR